MTDAPKFETVVLLSIPNKTHNARKEGKGKSKRVIQRKKKPLQSRQSSA